MKHEVLKAQSEKIEALAKKLAQASDEYIKADTAHAQDYDNNGLFESFIVADVKVRDTLRELREAVFELLEHYNAEPEDDEESVKATA